MENKQYLYFIPLTSVWLNLDVTTYSVSLGLLSHRISFMSKFGTARRHASISKHGTVASSSSGALLF